MVTVTATDFQKVMNIQTSTTDLEYVLDLTIDGLNIFGASLSNMSGTIGTKTVNLTSIQRGAVFFVAREIYNKFYKGVGTATTTGGFTVTVGDVLNDTELVALLQKLGEKLAASETEDLEVSYG